MASELAEEPEESFEETFRQIRYRGDLRRSVKYLTLLLSDIEQFEETAAPDEERRVGFQRLMMLVLGSDSTWDRLHKVSGRSGIGPGTLGRYALRVSSPHHVAYPSLLKAVREVLIEERAEIERVLLPLEEEERRKREEREAEWEALRTRVETVVSGSSLNCQVRFSEPNDGSYSLDFMFAYPCRGIYELSSMGTFICPVCDTEGKEHAHTHGRVLLAAEDGLMLLPQIVRTQADLMQVVDDMQVANEKKRMFLMPDNETWFDACKRFLQADPLVASLPPGDAASTKPYELADAQLGWFLC